MNAEIIPFVLTREAATRRVRQLMARGAYDIDPHCRSSMLERDISMRQVLIVANEGTINQGPALDEYQEWRCRLRKRVAGRLVRVVIAIQATGLLIVTTY